MARCKGCDALRQRAYRERNPGAVNRRRREAYVSAQVLRPPRRCKDCDRPTPSRRHWYCAEHGEIHRRMRNQRRQAALATSTARGYGGAHQKKREQWKDAIARGEVACARPECGRLIYPHEEWDLDHTDDRSGYLGASHRSCNRSAGARKGNAARAVQNAASGGTGERLIGW